MGDSLSAAYGIEIEEGWVNLLGNRLDDYDTNNNWHVVNASISGETTTGGYQRLPKLIEEYRPHICIIALGANDGLRGQSLGLMKNNLEGMVEICNADGQSLLVGMMLPPNYGAAFTNAFQKAFQDTAEMYNTKLVDFMLESIALQDEYFQADGLHPTAQAQPLILDTLWVELEQILNNN
ncbi:MAG: arylesterase [Pseudomonadota bacterium]